MRGVQALSSAIPTAAAIAPGDILNQLNFFVNQTIQVIATLTHAAVNQLTSFLGLASPSIPTLTGIANPLIPLDTVNGLPGGSGDPSIVYSNGQYYATYTSLDRIEIRSAPSIALLSIATPTVVFPSADTPPPINQSTAIFAPELQYLTDPADGQKHWYLYYSAQSPDSVVFSGHKIFVLESQSDSPLGPYPSAGIPLDTKTPSLTIDQNIYEAPDGRQYMFFGAYPSADSLTTEYMYVQALASPTQTVGDPVLVSKPTYSWESSPLGSINEAPQVVVSGNTLNVVYSGGVYFLPTGYSLGVLSVPVDSDLLDPQTWVNAKDPNPILTSSPRTGVWSPGHNSFFSSPDGSQTWIAYHAYNNPLDGLNQLLYSFLKLGVPDYRTTRVQPVSFDGNGVPVLGPPDAIAPQIPAPSGDPGLTVQFEGAPATTRGVLTVTVPQSGPAYVAGAGVRVLLSPGGGTTFTLTVPNGAYDVYLRQVADPYGGQYSVSVNGGNATQVNSAVTGVSLGTVTASDGTLTLDLASTGIAIANLDEIIAVPST